MRWDDPVFTGERGEWSWFVFRSPIEDLLRFWSQIETLRPISYIASGDNEVLVTRDPGFRAVLAQAISMAGMIAG